MINDVAGIYVCVITCFHIIVVNMVNVNITLSLPADLHKMMKKHDEIRWSSVVRKTIEKKLRDLELLDKLTSKSRLTEKDAEEISLLINKDIAKQLGLG